MAAETTGVELPAAGTRATRVRIRLAYGRLFTNTSQAKAATARVVVTAASRAAARVKDGREPQHLHPRLSAI